MWNGYCNDRKDVTAAGTWVWRVRVWKHPESWARASFVTQRFTSFHDLVISLHPFHWPSYSCFTCDKDTDTSRQSYRIQSSNLLTTVINCIMVQDSGWIFANQGFSWCPRPSQSTFSVWRVLNEQNDSNWIPIKFRIVEICYSVCIFAQLLGVHQILFINLQTD
jgi:hypothetical protein